MKKVFIAAALAAMIVSCGSKGNKSAEIIAESESDSIFAVNDSTLGELQTYSYEGILPAADAEGPEDISCFISFVLMYIFHNA